jgi:hypothetical protein
MNSVLWYVIYCILLYAFVGQYIEYIKIRSITWNFKKSDNCIKLYLTALFRALTEEEKV